MASGTRSRGQNLEDRITQKVEPESGDWKEQYCFSPQGKFLKHGIPNRIKNQMITTMPVNSRTKALRRGKKESEISRPSIQGTPEERQPAKPTLTIQCLIIGLAPFSEMTTPSKTKGGDLLAKKPESQDDDDEVKVPYRVVIDVATGEKMYALTTMKDGIGCGHEIARNEVFYFSEFVTSDTTFDARTKRWLSIAKQAAIGLTPASTLLKNSGDPTRFITEPEPNHANWLVILTILFNQNPQPWILQDMKRTLKLLEPDVAAKQPSFQGLWNFFDTDIGDEDDEWTDEESLKVLDEMATLWPEVAAHMNAGWLTLLRRGLVEGGLFVEHRMQRAFFAVASLKLPNIGSLVTSTDSDLKEIVEVIIKEAALILGEPGQGSQSKPSMMQDGEVKSHDKMGWIMVAAIKEILEATVKAGDITTEQLIALNGSQAPVPEDADEGDILHPATIFNEFMHAQDRDAAKLALGQTARIPFAAAAEMLRRCYKKPVEELLSALRRLNLPSLSQEDDNSGAVVGSGAIGDDRSGAIGGN